MKFHSSPASYVFRPLPWPCRHIIIQLEWTNPFPIDMNFKQPLIRFANCHLRQDLNTQ